MKLQTLTLAAALAFAGSAFAANGYGYGHDMSKQIEPGPSKTLRHETHPMKRVSLRHHRHHVTKHVAVVKPMHKRHYAFTRNGREHVAASSHPQRHNS